MTISTTPQSRNDRRPLSRPSKTHRGALGPYSRLIDRGALGGGIDGRSREGRFLRAYEAALTQHVGGVPTVTQRCLISRAARLALHLELLDERVLVEGKPMGQTDAHFYVAWSNALARHLRTLGVQAAAKPPPDPVEVLNQHLARRARETEAA